MASIARDGLDFDKIYPIGSIYISASGTNPHDLFGGTWEQLRDRFLLGCGSKENGTIGGEENHALSDNYYIGLVYLDILIQFLIIYHCKIL